MNTFYYEFREHEYYGLIVVSVDKYDLKTRPHRKAAEIYHETIGGESVEEVLEEAMPIQVTEELAFMRFLKSSSNEQMTVREAIEQFYSDENACLLVDSSLL